MLFNINRLQDLIYLIPAVLIALTIHEFSHGLFAYFLGDQTAKNQGRLSLNPLKHLDPMGALMLLIAGFGWAKPVPVNPYHFKNRKLGMAVTAFAGPLSNFIMAFIFTLIAIFMIKHTPSSEMTNNIIMFLQISITLNIGLGIFNLIPFPPLDGSRILGFFLPESVYFKLMEFERYTQIILIALLFTNVLNVPLAFLRKVVLTFMVNASNFIIQ